MSLSDADAKFPDQGASGIPPSPTRENPGQVYPKSDPKAAQLGSIPGTGDKNDPPLSQVLANPFALHEHLTRLQDALAAVIDTINQEQQSVGNSATANALCEKFKHWEEELRQIQGTQIQSLMRMPDKQGSNYAKEGGLFVD